METLEQNKIKASKVLFVLMVILSAYFAIKIFSEIKKDSLLGESTEPATISFSGHGEVDAVPDIANVDFTIQKDSSTVKDAQAGVATVEAKVLDFLKTSNIDSKDIQTASVSVYPTYTNVTTACPLTVGIGVVSNCNNNKQVISGYEASESITVKIRNTDNVGTITQGLGTLGVSQLDGPNFMIDNPDTVQAQARKLAIDDAKTKAQVLAKDLGVQLVRITNFSENSNNPPVFYAKAMSAGTVAVPAPAMIPAGENTITSDVTITYEIR